MKTCNGCHTLDRSQGFFGHPGLKDYTVQCDVLAVDRDKNQCRVIREAAEAFKITDDELRVVQTDSLKSCMSKQFYRFARGYIETGSDQNTLDNLNRLFADSGYDLQELMVGLTKLQTFTLRR